MRQPCYNIGIWYFEKKEIFKKKKTYIYIYIAHANAREQTNVAPKGRPRRKTLSGARGQKQSAQQLGNCYLKALGPAMSAGLL